MKYLLLLLVSFSLFAGDSGSYFDTDRSGEGLILQRDGDTMLFFFFTYGGESECGEPTVSPSLPLFSCMLNGQRWFFGSGTYNELAQSLTGSLYITEGIDYPDTVFKVDGGGDVGDATVIGRYTLVREGKGWLMFVTRFGNTLGADDPLFAEVYNFVTPMFKATD